MLGERRRRWEEENEDGSKPSTRIGILAASREAFSIPP